VARPLVKNHGKKAHIQYCGKIAKETALTIEIRNPELEALLQQRLKAGNFASVEALLMDTFRGAQQTMGTADTDRRNQAEAAAERLRGLRKGVKLERPEGMSLREYAHIGHRY
jgi:hypothetical protein